MAINLKSRSRRSSSVSSNSSSNSKEIELTTLDFLPFSSTLSYKNTEALSKKSSQRRQGIKSADDIDNGTDGIRSTSAFATYRTLTIIPTASVQGTAAEYDSSLTITDSSSRPQYVYTRSKRAATLSRINAENVVLSARMKYKFGLHSDAYVKILPTNTATPLTTPSDKATKSPQPDVPLIMLTSDAESEEDLPSLHASALQTLDKDQGEQHLTLTHGALSSSSTKFSVASLASTSGFVTLKWRSRSLQSHLLDIRNPVTGERIRQTLPQAESEQPAILSLVAEHSTTPLAKVVEDEDRKTGLRLLLGPQVRVNGQAGWDAEGHLVDGVVDESSVLATCLVVLKRETRWKGLV